MSGVPALNVFIPTQSLPYPEMLFIDPVFGACTESTLRMSSTV